MARSVSSTDGEKKHVEGDEKTLAGLWHVLLLQHDRPLGVAAIAMPMEHGAVALDDVLETHRSDDAAVVAMSRNHESDGRLRQAFEGHLTVSVEGGDDDSQHDETTGREQIQHAGVVVPPGATRSDAARRWLSHELTSRHISDKLERHDDRELV